MRCYSPFSRTRRRETAEGGLGKLMSAVAGESAIRPSTSACCFLRKRQERVLSMTVNFELSPYMVDNVTQILRRTLGFFPAPRCYWKFKTCLSTCSIWLPFFIPTSSKRRKTHCTLCAASYKNIFISNWYYNEYSVSKDHQNLHPILTVLPLSAIIKWRWWPSCLLGIMFEIWGCSRRFDWPAGLKMMCNHYFMPID